MSYYDVNEGDGGIPRVVYPNKNIIKKQVILAYGRVFEEVVGSQVAQKESNRLSDTKRGGGYQIHRECISLI